MGYRLKRCDLFDHRVNTPLLRTVGTRADNALNPTHTPLHYEARTYPSKLITTAIIQLLKEKYESLRNDQNKNDKMIRIRKNDNDIINEL